MRKCLIGRGIKAAYSNALASIIMQGNDFPRKSLGMSKEDCIFAELKAKPNYDRRKEIF